MKAINTEITFRSGTYRSQFAALVRRHSPMPLKKFSPVVDQWVRTLPKTQHNNTRRWIRWGLARLTTEGANPPKPILRLDDDEWL